MNLPKHILNEVVFVSTKRSHQYFRKNIDRARYIQLRILQRLLKQNSISQFGQKFGFGQIKGIQAYRSQVPILTYDDYKPWIDRIVRGEQRILTKERVLLLEPTGGSSGGSKLIPYTQSLQKEFQAGILTWWHDLYRRYPELRRGSAYWSITPAVHSQQNTGPVPVGFQSDAAYFGWRGLCLSGTLAVPPEVTRFKKVENFRYLTAYFLLKCHDLNLISIWNPTYLTLLLRDIQLYYDQLVADIHQGGITLPAGEDTSSIQEHLLPDPERAAHLRTVHITHGQQDFSQVWPNLKLVSCWMDAAAKEYSEQLRNHFSRVTFQGKGLLATEAMVSLPWTGAGGNVPAFTSHFLEFVSENDGREFLLHELRMGETYRVIVTTGGGLYRYDIGDRVQVTGHALGLPLLKFVGRDRVVDLVGEKLAESHIQPLISELLSRLRIDAKFVMLAPQHTEQGGYYVFYIETVDSGQENLLRQVRILLDSALKKNMQYAYARNIGQLAAPCVYQISQGGDRSFYQRCMQEGQRMGDIKPSILDKRSDWMNYFEGQMLHVDSGNTGNSLPLPGQEASA